MVTIKPNTYPKSQLSAPQATHTGPFASIARHMLSLASKLLECRSAPYSSTDNGQSLQSYFIAVDRV